MPATPARASKRVLYYAGQKSRSADFMGALGQVEGCSGTRGAHGPVFSCPNADFSFVIRHDVRVGARRPAPRVLQSRPARPARAGARHAPRRPGTSSAAWPCSSAMDQEPDIERRYGFHRIVALVSGRDAARGRSPHRDARRPRRRPRDARPVHLPPQSGLRRCCPTSGEFARRVLGEMAELTLPPPAGQGGALRLGRRHHRHVLRAGRAQVPRGLLPAGRAERLRPLLRHQRRRRASPACWPTATRWRSSWPPSPAIAGGRHPADRPEPARRRRTSTSRGLTAPLRQLFSMAGHGASELLRGRLPFSLESLVFEYGDLIHAPFSTDGFEALLAPGLHPPGLQQRLPRRCGAGSSSAPPTRTARSTSCSASRRTTRCRSAAPSRPR